MYEYLFIAAFLGMMYAFFALNANILAPFLLMIVMFAAFPEITLPYGAGEIFMGIGALTLSLIVLKVLRR